MSIEIHHPHDSFFRAGMSNLSVAKDVMKAHLEPELVEKTDWNSVQLTNKSYIDKHLRHLHSDMVYSCRIKGKESYIYILIEHQTEPYRLLPLKVLEYNVAMMREHINQGNKQLPLIANLVLYAGEQSPYPYSVDLYDCFEEPDEARKMIFKPLKLIDLGQIDEEELLRHGEGNMLELLLKQSRAHTFYKWLQEHRKELIALFDTDYWESALLYILSEEDEYDDEKILEEIISAKPSKKKNIMTAAQRLIDKGEVIGEKRGMEIGEKRGMEIGEKRGMEIGRHELQEEMAERMLKDGEPQERVVRFTNLPAEEVMKLSEKLNLAKN